MKLKKGPVKEEDSSQWGGRYSKPILHPRNTEEETPSFPFCARPFQVAPAPLGSPRLTDLPALSQPPAHARLLSMLDHATEAFPS